MFSLYFDPRTFFRPKVSLVQSYNMRWALQRISFSQDLWMKWIHPSYCLYPVLTWSENRGATQTWTPFLSLAEIKQIRDGDLQAARIPLQSRNANRSILSALHIPMSMVDGWQRSWCRLVCIWLHKWVPFFRVSGGFGKAILCLFLASGNSVISTGYGMSQVCTPARWLSLITPPRNSVILPTWPL